MKIINIQKNRGFTLIETMIAVFILVMAMNGLLGLIASSLFSARYAKNEIVANYLVQEAVDYVRNDRDTTVFQKNGGGTWATFQAKYSGNGCFTPDGCEIEPANTSSNVTACSGTVGGSFGALPCRVLNYDDSASNRDFYTYSTPAGYTSSNFKRQVKMSISPTNADELDIKVTVEWLNGSLVRTKISRVSLLNWQLP